MKPLIGYHRQVSTYLDDYFTTQLAAPARSKWDKDALIRLRSFAIGGKLIRGSLVCFSAALFGQGVSKAMTGVAAALEIAHSGLLIHDDFMDQSVQRRGRPAIHMQYQKLGRQRGWGNAEHSGSSLGITVADAGFFLAYQLFSELALPPVTFRQIIHCFSRELTAVCGGQMLDINLGATKTIPPKQTIFELMTRKTARYSFVLPLQLGTILANQSPQIKRHVEELGLAMGILFQIQDDILDLFGDPKLTGKPLGTDLKTGKKTLLIYYLNRQCSPPERRQLQRVLGRPNSSDQAITGIRHLVEQHQVMGKVHKDVAKLHQNAERIIKSLPISAAQRDLLYNFLEFCTARQA